MKQRLLLLIPLMAIFLAVALPIISIMPFGSVAHAAIPSDAALKRQGEAKAACQTAGFGGPDIKACADYYVNGFKDGYKNINKSSKDACKDVGITISICHTGYEAGQKDGKKALKEEQNNEKPSGQSQYSVCEELKDSAVAGAAFADCVTGYTGAYDGKSESAACNSSTVTSVNICRKGYAAGKSDKAAGIKSQADPPAKASTDQADESQLGCDLGIDASLGGVVNAVNPLNWLFCGMVKGLVGVVEVLDNIITSQLSVGTNGNSNQPNQIFADGNGKCANHGACESYHAAWASFRNIALGLLVIAGLIVLISQALGMELLDAYTIRKVLPRVLIAALGITLSWQLMQFFVTLANDLGFGVRRLIYAPFNDLNSSIHLDFAQSFGVSILAGVGYFFSGAFGLLTLAATGALAVFVAFLVIILRQIAIIMLIILAPIGIIAYVLPNTQKIYKFWWNSFSLALMMFPLIAGFIAIGRVFSAIAINASDNLLYQLVGFAAYFAPYFLIPLTFKFAGGAVRQLGGFVNDRGRGAFDGLRKARQRNASNRFKAARTGGIYRPTFGQFGKVGANGERKSVGKYLNKFGDWTLDFDERARLGLGNQNVPGFRRGAKVMQSQIEEDRIKQNAKAMSETDLDYKTGRAVSGLFNKGGMAGSLNAQDRAVLDSEYGTEFDPTTGQATAWRAPRGLQEFNQVADLLGSGNAAAREASEGLRAKAPMLDNLPLAGDETRRGDTRLVGLMAAAKQGRLDNEDIINNHNMLLDAGQRERAMRETAILQELSTPKRSSLARGHAIEFDESGRALDVYRDPTSAKAQDSIARMSMQDVANSKSEDLDGLIGQTWIAGASDGEMVLDRDTGKMVHATDESGNDYVMKSGPAADRAREIQGRLKSMAMYNYGDTDVGRKIKDIWVAAGHSPDELNFKPADRSPADAAGMVAPPKPDEPGGPGQPNPGP